MDMVFLNLSLINDCAYEYLVKVLLEEPIRRLRHPILFLAKDQYDWLYLETIFYQSFA